MTLGTPTCTITTMTHFFGVQAYIQAICPTTLGGGILAGDGIALLDGISRMDIQLATEATDGAGEMADTGMAIIMVVTTGLIMV
jgi:hypothetical protein